MGGGSHFWLAEVGARSVHESVKREAARPLPPDPIIEYYKQFVDRTLIRENLKKTREERLEMLMGLQAFYDEAQRLRERRNRDGGS